MSVKQLVTGGIIVSFLLALAVGIGMKSADEQDPLEQSARATQDMADRVSADAARNNPVAKMMTVRKPVQASPRSVQTAPEENQYGQDAQEQGTQEHFDFLEPEGERVTDSEFKAWIEMNKMTTAMQKGPEALDRYLQAKARKDNRVMLQEENRLAQQEYRESLRQWRLRRAEAQRIAGETGDTSELDELKNRRPVRPGRIRPEDLQPDTLQD